MAGAPFLFCHLSVRADPPGLPRTPKHHLPASRPASLRGRQDTPSNMRINSITLLVSGLLVHVNPLPLDRAPRHARAGETAANDLRAGRAASQDNDPPIIPFNFLLQLTGTTGLQRRTFWDSPSARRQHVNELAKKLHKPSPRTGIQQLCGSCGKFFAGCALSCRQGRRISAEKERAAAGVRQPAQAALKRTPSCRTRRVAAVTGSTVRRRAVAATQHQMQHEGCECSEAGDPVRQHDAVADFLAAVIQQQARQHQQ